MKKILFFIHDLGPGGAEKVLVNLVNNMDPEAFEVTVMSLIGGGVNEQFLKPHVRSVSCFKKLPRGHTHILKLWTPAQLHARFIRERYDIEVSYLEGPSARIISGCPHSDTKLVSWIHGEQNSRAVAARSFRSFAESERCYHRFHRIICVSEYVKRDFSALYPNLDTLGVLYNTNETGVILQKKAEPVEDGVFTCDEIKMCGVGRLIPSKGFDCILRIHKRLKEQGYPVHTYLLGKGAEQGKLEAYVRQNELTDSVTFLGYRTNPYKYVANCDLFVCASLAEGFSTAATEALIVGTPVCTVDVSGMKEMLGENNEYGIVTQNDEEALYQGIKRLLDDPELLAYYQNQALLRGKNFSTENTVKAVQDMFMAL